MRFLLILLSVALMGASSDKPTRRDYGAAYQNTDMCDAITYGAGWKKRAKVYVYPTSGENHSIAKEARFKWNNGMAKGVLLPTENFADADITIQFMNAPSNAGAGMFGWARVTGTNKKGSPASLNEELNDDSYFHGDLYELKRAELEIFVDRIEPECQKYGIEDERSLGLCKKSYKLSTVIHEFGHALGLSHAHGTNNIMSYTKPNPITRFYKILEEQASLRALETLFDDRTLNWRQEVRQSWEDWDEHEKNHLIWRNVYYNKIEPSDLDWWAMNCLYPFETWNSR